MIGALQVLVVVSLLMLLPAAVWALVASYRADPVLTLLALFLCAPLWGLLLWRHWRRLGTPFLLAAVTAVVVAQSAFALIAWQEVCWAEQVERGTASFAPTSDHSGESTPEGQ